MQIQVLEMIQMQVFQMQIEMQLFWNNANASVWKYYSNQVLEYMQMQVFKIMQMEQCLISFKCKWIIDISMFQLSV